ncbi:MAG: ABC transporter substrate-binding protein [Sporichthyaceae bacterium]
MSISLRTHSRLRATVAVSAVLAVAAVSGCGNRIDRAKIEAVGNGYGPVDAARDAARDAIGDLASGTPEVASAPAGIPLGTTEVAPDPGAGQVPVIPGKAGKPSPGTPVDAGADPASKPAKATTGVKKEGAPAVAAPAACPTGLAPIVLGQTLAASGLVGAAISGLRTGLAIWAADVNARGGVQCHEVRLIQLDDASDPARVSANWNSIVKDKGAVAVVGAGTPIAIAALRSSAERDKVPVVGGDITAVDWVQSEYLFPTGGTPLTSYDGGVVDAAKVAKGPLKAGIFYCVEASICTGLKNNYPKSAERAGAALGPIQAVSLTQPDFTSECQTMKSAGVNVLFFGLDGSASIRAARSCASLNYFPTIATGAIAVSAQAAADKGLQRNTTFLGSGLVPYTTTDTAGIKAFHIATKRYAPSAAEDQQTLLGWAAGKLFEAALAKVSERARAGDVTTAMVLEGLWQLKNEKLDGLSPGATFTKGQPATSIDCYYGLRLDSKGFGAVNGSEPVCFGASARAVSPGTSGALVPDPTPQEHALAPAQRRSILPRAPRRVR